MLFNVLGMLSTLVCAGLLVVNVYLLITDNIGVRRHRVSRINMGRHVITRLPGTTSYRRDMFVKPTM